MRINIVQGEIETLGESSKEENMVKTYDYISFRDVTGQDIVVKKVKVWNEVDRILVPGVAGTFVIAKFVGVGNELHAAKVADREVLSDWLQGGSMTKMYAILFVVLLLGIFTSFIVVGIPLVVLAIWGLFGLPRWRKHLQEAARRAGFKLQQHARTKII